MSNNKNRRGFLKNIGIAIAGAATTAVIAPQIAEAITQSNTSDSNQSSVNATNGLPSFEDCYQKVLRKEILTEIEVIIYSSKMNKLAWESDTQILSNLRSTCSSEQEFEEQKLLHISSKNSIMYYWCALPNNMNDKSVQNLIQVHKYVVNSILQVVNGYYNYKSDRRKT